MKRFAPIYSALIIFALAVFAVAQKPVGSGHPNGLTTGPGGPAIFPLEDLRPGMKGTARTVFSGSDTEEFGVEILGVLPGFPAPRQSAIIARLSGPQIERTSVFAGMSGSPVYIDGKIVGAIAFSFPFAKEPIAGITPIKQMIDLFNKGTENQNNKPKEPRPVSFAQLASVDWKPELPKPAFSGAPMVAPVAAGSPLMPYLGRSCLAESVRNRFQCLRRNSWPMACCLFRARAVRRRLLRSRMLMRTRFPRVVRSVCNSCAAIIRSRLPGP
jgi:hypothetical protein